MNDGLLTVTIDADGPHYGFTCDCCGSVVMLVDRGSLMGACWECGDWEFVTRTLDERA